MPWESRQRLTSARILNVGCGGCRLGFCKATSPSRYPLSFTYDHTHWKTRDPVRSPIDKPMRAGLVVGSVTTSEYLVLRGFECYNELGLAGSWSWFRHGARIGRRCPGHRVAEETAASTKTVCRNESFHHRSKYFGVRPCCKEFSVPSIC
ncbi:uncharacterized protein BDZ83DRAFT_270851 [Colletotrichum acutatum]|uniref:Uncharacterized protein n=1 Tax=Glomerella acutata TaxID=27357 RepID=A0AAD8UQJ2_GLOAC|nr:uncharacterized protein BDZ83DRAFT_270851 [Colletotrichum acutatum]KAK1726064.1 hypothetical protein BDZ83DRAFT_270851 [Colletotrichum acutatum]